jgi:hypothetical protein
MRGIIVTISMISFVLNGFAQQNVELRIRKNVRDKLDDLVFEFEQFSRFSSNDEISNFTKLFDKDALVFDYLTPNYLTRNTGQELIKEYDDFVADIRKDYPRGLSQSRIIDTNLGEAIDYRQLKLDSPQVAVNIRIVTIGEYVEGGQFSNDALLTLNIQFDTLAGNVYNFRIISINKLTSELRYQKEERAPKFEKQIISKAYLSWNQVQTDDPDGNYYVSVPMVTNETISQSHSINFIRILAAPEPEEFSMSFGLAYNQSEYNITAENYFYSYLTINSFNEAEYRNVTGQGITEKVTSQLVEMPILFRYERKFSRIFSVFVQTGLSLNYHLSAHHTGGGMFSYTGYLPKYNLALIDEPDFGYLNDQLINDRFVITPNKFSRDYFGLNGLADLGFSLENKNGWVFYLGATAHKGIVNNKRITDFSYVSSEINNYNGLFPVLNSINFGGYGIMFGIRKRFRSRNGVVKMIAN